MFKYLIVFAEIALLVGILRSSFAQYVLSDIQSDLTTLMTEISLALEHTQLEDVRHSLHPYTSQMRDFQKDYIYQITENSASLEQFHDKYCLQREINPYVNGTNLAVVCQTISTSTLIEQDS